MQQVAAVASILAGLTNGLRSLQGIPRQQPSVALEEAREPTLAEGGGRCPGSRDTSSRVMLSRPSAHAAERIQMRLCKCVKRYCGRRAGFGTVRYSIIDEFFICLQLQQSTCFGAS
jgi:hypothetical protein